MLYYYHSGSYSAFIYFRHDRFELLFEKFSAKEEWQTASVSNSSIRNDAFARDGIKCDENNIVSSPMRKRLTYTGVRRMDGMDSDLSFLKTIESMVTFVERRENVQPLLPLHTSNEERHRRQSKFSGNRIIVPTHRCMPAIHPHIPSSTIVLKAPHTPRYSKPPLSPTVQSGSCTPQQELTCFSLEETVKAPSDVLAPSIFQHYTACVYMYTLKGSLNGISKPLSELILQFLKKQTSEYNWRTHVEAGDLVEATPSESDRWDATDIAFSALWKMFIREDVYDNNIHPHLHHIHIVAAAITYLGDTSNVCSTLGKLLTTDKPLETLRNATSNNNNKTLSFQLNSIPEESPLIKHLLNTRVGTLFLLKRFIDKIRIVYSMSKTLPSNDSLKRVWLPTFISYYEMLLTWEDGRNCMFSYLKALIASEKTMHLSSINAKVSKTYTIDECVNFTNVLRQFYEKAENHLNCKQLQYISSLCTFLSNYPTWWQIEEPLENDALFVTKHVKESNEESIDYQLFYKYYTVLFPAFTYCFCCTMKKGGVRTSLIFNALKTVSREMFYGFDYVKVCYKKDRILGSMEQHQRIQYKIFYPAWIAYERIVQQILDTCRDTSNQIHCWVIARKYNVQSALKVQRFLSLLPVPILSTDITSNDLLSKIENLLMTDESLEDKSDHEIISYTSEEHKFWKLDESSTSVHLFEFCKDLLLYVWDSELLGTLPLNTTIVGGTDLWTTLSRIANQDCNEVDWDANLLDLIENAKCVNVFCPLSETSQLPIIWPIQKTKVYVPSAMVDSDYHRRDKPYLRMFHFYQREFPGFPDDKLSSDLNILWNQV